MPEGTLSAKHRRTALETLSRDRLAEITSKFDLTVEDKRAQAAHIDAIIKARSVHRTLELPLRFGSRAPPPLVPRPIVYIIM